jgi:hypothetical protein
MDDRDLDKPLTKREWQELEDEKRKAASKTGLKVLIGIIVLFAVCSALFVVLQFVACGFMPAGCH